MTSGDDDVDLVLKILHLDLLDEMHELTIELMKFVQDATRIRTLSAKGETSSLSRARNSSWSVSQFIFLRCFSIFELFEGN